MPVVIKGLAETRVALRKFAPDLLKESDKEIRQVLKTIVVQARGFVPLESPMSGWSQESRKPIEGASRWGLRKFNTPTIRTGIVYQVGAKRIGSSGYTSLYAIQNKTAAGAIYETAGWKSDGEGTGVKFIENIRKQSPGRSGTGRLAYRAVEENNGKAIRAITKALEATTAIFNRRAGEK